MILLNTYLDSFEELTGIAHHWNAEFQQMGSEQFKPEVFQARTDLLLYSRARFGCFVRQQGATPPGMRTFAIPNSDCTDFNWFGHKVNKNNLLIFPVHGDIDAFTRPGFNMATISLPENYLHELLEKNDIRKVKNVLAPHEIVKEVPTDFLNELRLLINQLEQTTTKSSQSQYLASFTNTIQMQIIACLVTILTENQSTHRLMNPKNLKLIKNLTDYIHTHLNEQMRIKQLCRQAKISERTIQNLFKKELGILPKSYILGAKLNHVHHSLWHANFSDTFVGDIAFNAGFLHMGQFATDYYKVFNELPSDTLKRSISSV